MLHHAFCQRFAFHSFGMQQQEQDKKLLLPLEELTLALHKMRVWEGFSLFVLHFCVFRRVLQLMVACFCVSRLQEPAEPGHGPAFSHASLAQTEGPAGLSQTRLAASVRPDDGPVSTAAWYQLALLRSTVPERASSSLSQTTYQDPQTHSSWACSPRSCWSQTSNRGFQVE